ncbi:MAG: TonB-dependent receptor plug domain-containing protein [Prevotella sp.]|nr:TonB-dependent receptor [Prevotella sp.]MCH3994253.1 TonB-dependent receptor plug domain-containing protein [Prevotella sp.]
MRKKRLRTVLIMMFCSVCTLLAQNNQLSIIKGDVKSNNTPVSYAKVYLKDNTSISTQTDDHGNFSLSVAAGSYTLCVSYVGHAIQETKIKNLKANETRTVHIKLNDDALKLKDVVVVAKSPIQQIKESAYNVIAIDTKALQNSTKNLSDALAQAPGIKLRESGGVGSDMQLMMDGFDGKQVKVFIDGVPQEGVGSSFGLNNIPVNYADRIEVYKGVVPVGFGTDALGGVINIITKKHPENNWFVDASYSYGSFNTHKSYINFGQTFKNGFTYEINAFQNYSDNDYHVDTPVKDFSTGAINNTVIEHVKRFHDTYHNEAVIGKIGFVNKSWADRLMLGLAYSHMHKDIQTGVRQEIVFGGKFRKGYSLMPSLEYQKHNLFTKGLNVTLTANYNKNITENVDTSSYEYNWRGEKRLMRMPGEQVYQDVRSKNNNWNGTFTANYYLGKANLFTLNYVMDHFKRTNKSLLNETNTEDAIAKETRKGIGGLSYRLMPSDHWNLSVFGKYYHQYVAGPIATSAAQDKYTRTNKTTNTFGYGVAGTYFILKSLQAKLSYEKAYRLPTNEEMFGDEDMESGDVKIKPENSNNINFNVGYNGVYGKHTLYVEGGLIFRYTKDYIQRKLVDLSGGKSGATYENHGRVKTRGYNVSARYGFANWVSVGGNFTQMNVYDNVKTVSEGSGQKNLTYGTRMPNIPYRFANADVTFYWRDLWKKNNLLTVTYDNFYVHNFPLYSEALGSSSKFVVPSQFSHNITVSYSMHRGRYNISFECRNFTNEKLYDNFSLQKAGRAFYGKFRVYFGN